MRFVHTRAATILLAGALLASCADSVLAPTQRGITPGAASRSVALPPPPIRFSEIHYDNASTDVGEAVEISGPAGTSLVGWKVVPYNGADGRQYSPITTLNSTIPATCGTRGVITVSITGLQNGAPDGIALVDAGGTVIEFLSYEGVLTAVDGPAIGLTSTDIGVAELGADPAGQSLARDASGAWHASAISTFNQCNDDVLVVGPIASVTVAPATATITVGGTQQFTASAFDAQGNAVTTATFTWASSATNIATVNTSGLATGAAPGDADITATANGIVGTATLHVNPVAPPVNGTVRISEIHYDNIGTDAGEAIEVEAPAGANLTGWSIVLYNGDPASRSTYGTAQTLNGTVVGACSGRGVLAVSYPSNGIQNGNPDGVALVDPNGAVVEFLSYGGTFTAANGPAAGQTSVDIGIAESNATTAVGTSLQRDFTGFWFGSATASFGTCNTQPPQVPPIVINELMADTYHAPGGSSFGEWFEVYNGSSQPVNLQGWTIVSTGQPNHVIASSVIVPANGYAVLGRSNDVTKNGGVTVNYSYFTGQSNTTIFLDATDVLELRDQNGNVVDAVQWTTASTIAKGVTRALKDPALVNSNVDGANWAYSTVTFGDGDYGTPGAANGTLAATPPIVFNTISFSGRDPGDPALPVGFEDQLFATLRGPGGVAIPTTFTWSSDTPNIATIDQNGVMHGVAAGTAVFRATASDLNATEATFSFPIAVATASNTALYGNNTEFGDPKDSDASDDFIVRRTQFASSYNKTRGTPNWVAYNLEATHIGSSVDRCDCFTHDPVLPANFTRLTTADYTGAGAAAGYGIDRGHLARSFDRTSGTLDNAYTYLFSNIIPQAADQNQGPWASMENFLGNLATSQNKEVYIVAGVAGNKGSVKNEGKIVIPAATWKVAVIMPRDQGLANVLRYTDLEVIAVIMPNDPGVRNVDWNTYRTTVDAVEALSGYDLLSLLPDKIEAIVEANTKPPIAAVNGPFNGAEGSSISMSAAASVDPNGTISTYSWNFGDGSPTGSGSSASHTYTQDGTYTVTLTVTDNDGLTDAISSTVTVTNVTPTIAAFSGAALLVNETYAVSGSFTDPGSDTWSATVDYGDGSGVAPLSLTGKTFALSHKYTAAGSFTVTVRVSDDDGTVTRTATVTVATALQGNQAVSAMVAQLIEAGKISKGEGGSLNAKLDAAARSIERESYLSARGLLEAFINEVEAMRLSGRLSSDDADALKREAQRVIASLSS